MPRCCLRRRSSALHPPSVCSRSVLVLSFLPFFAPTSHAIFPPLLSHCRLPSSSLINLSFVPAAADSDLILFLPPTNSDSNLLYTSHDPTFTPSASSSALPPHRHPSHNITHILDHPRTTTIYTTPHQTRAHPTDSAARRWTRTSRRSPTPRTRWTLSRARGAGRGSTGTGGG
ncbi:hypothetical protein B0H19DRAFT_1124727 [Mycena capillaripes]|nr:hypothetical protein B0H19DRAFT_1124727 [Mycena capillaripes]